MTTRADVRAEVQSRLGDTAAEVWTVDELNGIIDFVIRGLYPTFFQRKVGETTAADGPLQVAPIGARNLFMVGHKKTSSTRVRSLRKWTEGDGDAYVPRTGISGDLLVWAWTEGWDAPASDVEELTIHTEALEVVVLRAAVAALEKLLTDRVSVEKFHAIQVRQGATEEDIDLLISNFRDSIEERVRNTRPLPEIDK